MSKIELKQSSKIIVVFGGIEYEMKRPTLGVQMAFEEALEAAQENKRLGAKALFAFLTACGLPEEVVKELETDQITALVAALNEVKKN